MVGGGFTCPDCGGQCKDIIETRPDVAAHQERVLRRRRCPDCGYIKRTVELDDDRTTARIPNVAARLSLLRRDRELLA